MSQAELYIYLTIAVLLMSLLPAAVFFCRVPRKKKKEMLMEMGLSCGLPSSIVGSQVVVHRSLPVLVDQHHQHQQQLPFEAALTWDSGLPTYEEAMKSRRADIGLDCQY